MSTKKAKTKSNESKKETVSKKKPNQETVTEIKTKLSELEKKYIQCEKEKSDLQDSVTELTNKVASLETENKSYLDTIAVLREKLQYAIHAAMVEDNDRRDTYTTNSEYSTSSSPNIRNHGYSSWN